VELVNRAPEFVEGLPRNVTFIKNSPELKIFEYTLPTIIDAEGNHYEVLVDLDYSFISFDD
jgi:hypothetical protein